MPIALCRHARPTQIRKLGSTEGFWYDEAVLLPASSSDIQKQIVRQGPGYMLPRHAQVSPACVRARACNLQVRVPLFGWALAAYMRVIGAEINVLAAARPAMRACVGCAGMNTCRAG